MFRKVNSLPLLRRTCAWNRLRIGHVETITKHTYVCSLDAFSQPPESTQYDPVDNQIMAVISNPSADSQVRHCVISSFHDRHHSWRLKQVRYPDPVRSRGSVFFDVRAHGDGLHC